MVNGVLLPALMLVPAHPALMFETWNVLQLFAYPMRFRFYHLLQARAHLMFTSLQAHRSDIKVTV